MGVYWLRKKRSIAVKDWRDLIGQEAKARGTQRDYSTHTAKSVPVAAREPAPVTVPFPTPIPKSQGARGHRPEAVSPAEAWQKRPQPDLLVRGRRGILRCLPDVSFYGVTSPEFLAYVSAFPSPSPPARTCSQVVLVDKNENKKKKGRDGDSSLHSILLYMVPKTMVHNESCEKSFFHGPQVACGLWLRM